MIKINQTSSSKLQLYFVLLDLYKTKFFIKFINRLTQYF